jgi:predicted ArsR family transcriptional regulator
MPLYFPRSTDHSILELLETHESLAYEQIAAHLNEDGDAVGVVLQSLRARGLVEALVFGQPAERVVSPVAYWRLTDKGRAALARRREDAN